MSYKFSLSPIATQAISAHIDRWGPVTPAFRRKEIARIIRSALSISDLPISAHILSNVRERVPTGGLAISLRLKSDTERAIISLRDAVRKRVGNRFLSASYVLNAALELLEPPHTDATTASRNPNAFESFGHGSSFLSFTRRTL